MPAGLNWETWIGPAPMRPYHRAYHPATWRCWWDFGCGMMGDRGVHTLDSVVTALKLTAPSSIDATCCGSTREVHPLAAVVTFQFPARGSLPPVKLRWYEGMQPPRPVELEDGASLPAEGGAIFKGTKGTLVTGVTASTCPSSSQRQEGKRRKPPAQTLPRVQGSHELDWVRACKAGTQAGADFAFAGPLTETCLLGNIAKRVETPHPLGRRDAQDHQPAAMPTSISAPSTGTAGHFEQQGRCQGACNMITRTRRSRRAGWLFLMVLGILVQGGAVRPAEFVTPGEMQRKSDWIKAHLDTARPSLPFSFVYGGKESGDLIGAWPKVTETARIDAVRTRHTVTWTDPASGLEVRCAAVEYADYPAVEWTVFLKNTSSQNSGLLEAIQGIDLTLTRASEGEFVLHHWKGDTFAADLYEPLEQTLGPGIVARFAPVGGRGSNGAFPYYNLVTPGGGLMIAVGWPGQWASSFARDSGARFASWRVRSSRTWCSGPANRYARRSSPWSSGKARIWFGRRTSGGGGCSPIMCHGPPTASFPLPSSSATPRSNSTRCAMPTRRTRFTSLIVTSRSEFPSHSGGWTQAGIPAAASGPKRARGNPTSSGSRMGYGQSATTPGAAE